MSEDNATRCDGCGRRALGYAHELFKEGWVKLDYRDNLGDMWGTDLCGKCGAQLRDQMRTIRLRERAGSKGK